MVIHVVLYGFLGYERFYELSEVKRPFKTCKPPPGLAGWMRLGL